MKVLVGCEESGMMRDAFIAAGHDAISCDLMPTRRPGPHIQGDIMQLRQEHFDLGIFHPVCKYLTNSGVKHLHTDIKRWVKLFEAAAFFNAIKDFNCDRMAIENPIPHKYAKALIGDYTQCVQPWWFGDPRCKATCWWLYNLPKLYKTNDVREEMLALPKSVAQEVHYASPGPDRERIRSESYPGMCAAAAEIWGGVNNTNSQQATTKALNRV